MSWLRVNLRHRLFLLSPRLSASPAVAHGRSPPAAVTAVSVNCRPGGLDAMVPHTPSSLVDVNGASGRCSSRWPPPIHAGRRFRGTAGFSPSPWWPDPASGMALLRLAVVNGLQSCGPTLGIDSMQSVACFPQMGPSASQSVALTPYSQWRLASRRAMVTGGSLIPRAL